MDAATINSILLTLSSLLLAGLTAIYVFLANKMLKESRRANSLNQVAFERQLQLTLLPHMNCTAQFDNNEVILTIQNLGSVPANDIDVLAVASYAEVEIPPEKFVALYVKKDSDLKKRLFEGEEGSYGVYDHLVYFSMPHGKQVTVPLHLPSPPEYLEVLLQFRDIVGVSYHSLYWFFIEDDGVSAQRFRLGAIDPQDIQPHSRVTFNTGHNLRLETEDGSPLPEHITKQFEPTWNASLPCGHLAGSYPGVEDRGKWGNVR